MTSAVPGTGRLIAAGAVILAVAQVAACGSTHSPGLYGEPCRVSGQRERGTAAAPARTAAAVPPCTNSTLRPSLAPTGAAAGTAYYALRLTNVSGKDLHPVRLSRGVIRQRSARPSDRQRRDTQSALPGDHGGACQERDRARHGRHRRGRQLPRVALPSRHGARAPRLPARPDHRRVCQGEFSRLLSTRDRAHGNRDAGGTRRARHLKPQVDGRAGLPCRRCHPPGRRAAQGSVAEERVIFRCPKCQR